MIEYDLLCPECVKLRIFTYLARGLTEEEFHSPQYLDGDEPLLCEVCLSKKGDTYDGPLTWVFPVIVSKNTTTVNATTWASMTRGG